MPSLLIADDHPLFRAALRGAAVDAVDELQVREAGSLDEVLGILESGTDIDLVLLDLHMPRAAVSRTRSDSGDADLAARLASLSPQQFRVLTLVAQGLLNKQIADRLDVQERTVKAHLSAIFERLGVRNRTQAGVVLRELELSDPARQMDVATTPPAGM